VSAAQISHRYEVLPIPFLFPINCNSKYNNVDFDDMNDSLRPLVCEDDQVWIEASAAAQEQTQATVRRVLRSVAVQALGQRLAKRRVTASASRRLVVTADDITAVQAFCQALAERWKAANLAKGNAGVAAWIHEVAAGEVGTLYGGVTPSESSPAATLVPVATTNALPAGVSNHMVTAYARLQSLSIATAAATRAAAATSTLSPAPSLYRTSLQQLDRWGNRRATYWPGTWGGIQGAAAHIPTRLYKNPPVEVKLVHASQLTDVTVGGAQNPQQKHRKAIDWLLDRKRKSVGRERLPPKRVKRTPPPSQTAAAATTALPHQAPESSRPASHEGSGTWSRDVVAATLTEADRKLLDDYIVQDDGVASEQQETSPPSVILGALVDLGQWHGHEQTLIDHEDDMDDTALDGGFTEKQKRRYMRQALKQRLGDHTVIDGYNEEHAGGATRRHRRASRLVPTVDEVGRRWLEGDLLGCRVEVRDPQTMERHVLDFESLEIMLLDEDEVGDRWPDQEL
jgi:hypothetical protein